MVKVMDISAVKQGTCEEWGEWER